MASRMIDGVTIRRLNVIPDERGRIVEILRNDDPEFVEFGQIYISATYPGVVKAWHLHEHQTDHFACIHGMVKLVLYDNREGSPTKGEVQEIYVGVHNPVLVTVPKLVLHGWMCVSEHEALVVNVPDKAYNYKAPDELRVPAHDPSVPYTWARKDR